MKNTIKNAMGQKSNYKVIDFVKTQAKTNKGYASALGNWSGELMTEEEFLKGENQGFYKVCNDGIVIYADC